MEMLPETLTEWAMFLFFAGGTAVFFAILAFGVPVAWSFTRYRAQGRHEKDELYEDEADDPVHWKGQSITNEYFDEVPEPMPKLAEAARRNRDLLVARDPKAETVRFPKYVEDGEGLPHEPEVELSPHWMAQDLVDDPNPTTEVKRIYEE